MQRKSLEDVRSNKRRRRLKKSMITFLIIVLVTISSSFVYKNLNSDEKNNNATDQSVKEPKFETDLLEKPKQVEKKPEPIKETTFKISAAGDFTLGTDETFAFNGSFVDEANKEGLNHFVEGLDGIFQDDDFSTVNLETTLTHAKEKAIKKFRFKGDPSYAKILTLGGIESVNIANNHIWDYLQKGYDDTINTLKSNNISYFGYDNKLLTTVKGIKLGALGYEGWYDTPEMRQTVEQDIKYLRNNGAQIVLVHYHWGSERHYVPNESQKSLARFTVDSGADLILGHHPHVVQGIEEYKGKFIVYSLGNFMFGGNRNPSDKDTFVFQQTFHLRNGVVTDKKDINVVPFSISSVSSRNNYQPTKLNGSEAVRVKQKIIDSSNKINGSDWLVYDQNEQTANAN